ncbi:methylase, putative [Theileria annulata]|uniref:Methylase, putative n=1 Tax=Theileria annulata TaxID=5874 RepID=Q4U8N8_THEAN|nr:methylase, putative [Theileria annulata]CAI76815.1 methylase, putative [Theileria annulata]|eukprot:XP_953440.1 methylase, putative [Theileria annulata]
MLKVWNRPYNVILKCLRGLEHNLFNELQSFGFDRDQLIKANSKITVNSCNLKQLYFLSYFSRLASSIYFEVGKLPLFEKGALFNSCQSITWSDFLGSNNSYMINCDSLITNSYIKSKKYACQLVKDGINNHFSNNLNLEPPRVNFSQPEVKLEIDVDKDCIATLLVDSSGSRISSRGYRFKPNIGDIDPTMACSILYDVGYSSFSNPQFSFPEYEQVCNSDGSHKLNKLDTNSLSESESLNRNSIVDLFSGSGVFLIESALYSARIPPGYFRRRFSFQNFPVFDNESFEILKKYTDSKRIPTTSEEWKSLKGKFIGIERDWEKLDASLRSSEKAGILDLMSFNQAEYLKDGIHDAKKNSNSNQWNYMVAQLPQMRNLNHKPNNNQSSDGDPVGIPKERSKLSPERYSTLLKSLSRVKNRHFPTNSKTILILPSFMDRDLVQNSFSYKLGVGKSFNKDGILLKEDPKFSDNTKQLRQESKDVYSETRVYVSDDYKWFYFNNLPATHRLHSESSHESYDWFVDVYVVSLDKPVSGNILFNQK